MVKSFRQYVIETTVTPDTSKIHAVIAAYGSSMGAGRLGNATARLAAIASGQIYNADFGDIKQLANSLGTIEHALLDSEFYKPARALPTEKDRQEFIDLYAGYSGKLPGYNTGMQGAKKSLTTWSHDRDKFPGLIQVTEAYLALKAALDYLKPKIIKGKPPKPVDPNKFVKPSASYDSEKEVMKFIQGAAASVHEELYHQWVTREKNNIAKIAGAGITDVKSYKAWLKDNPKLQLLAQSCIDMSKKNYPRLLS